MGIKKAYWADIREKLAKIEPEFTHIIDQINPDHTYPLYIAEYTYGTIIADPEDFYLPNNQGGTFTLNDDECPEEYRTHLGYGHNSLPMGVVLENNIEWSLNLTSNDLSIPWLLYKPGAFFSYAKVFGSNSNRIYAPNNVLTMTAGSKTAFMLPNIGCTTQHVNLQRDYFVKSSTPKKIQEHWEIFKEIYNSRNHRKPWTASIAYFSEKWYQQLNSDPAWKDLKLFLHQRAWENFDFRRNSVYYDMAYSIIQKSRNLKPNPYLADTAKHIFTIALGEAPGYAPAIDESSLPVAAIQQAYIQSYGLKKYIPTIMQPTYFNENKKVNAVYYSLQNPSTYSFSPKSTQTASTLSEMRELAHIIDIFTNELASKDVICSDTVINDLGTGLEFNYFHNKHDNHNIIQPSAQILENDSRFNKIQCKTQPHYHSEFSADAPFVRGCIKISTK